MTEEEAIALSELFIEELVGVLIDGLDYDQAVNKILGDNDLPPNTATVVETILTKGETTVTMDVNPRHLRGLLDKKGNDNE